MTTIDRPLATRRAYTLRVTGEDRNDDGWREALWNTHVAVNKGARAFGDWLLTFRGGIDLNVLDEIKPRKGEDPSDVIRKQRVLLALSWLTVESRLGAPEKYIVASGDESVDSKIKRGEKVISALRGILKKRGVHQDEIEDWVRGCGPALRASIRDDAVWVNRSQAFDDAVADSNSALSREDVWDFLGAFFQPTSYFKTSQEGLADDEEFSSPQNGQKDFAQKAGTWLSKRFGTGKSPDFHKIADSYSSIIKAVPSIEAGLSGTETIEALAAKLPAPEDAENALAGVVSLISRSGRPSGTYRFLGTINNAEVVDSDMLDTLLEKASADKEKSIGNQSGKSPRMYSDYLLDKVEGLCGLTYLSDGDKNSLGISVFREKQNKDKENSITRGPSRHFEFAVMLDHAARRVSIAHSSIQNAESKRGEAQKAESDLGEIPEAARRLLDEYCDSRSDSSGALDPHRIRRSALDGWDQLLAKWQLAAGEGQEQERVEAVKDLRGDSDSKFGDARLFIDLAADKFRCVWHKDGDTDSDLDHEMLVKFAKAQQLRYDQERFKVPAYRHPCELLHPVFCDFGNSRWTISYDLHRARKAKSKVADFNPRGFSLELLTGQQIKAVRLRWQSKRLAKDLDIDSAGEEPSEDSVNVARSDRLALAATGASRKSSIDISGLFGEKNWNGRLQLPRDQLRAIASVRDNPNLSDAEKSTKMTKLRGRLKWIVTFSAKLTPSGPWCEYAQDSELGISPRAYLHTDENKPRKQLSRIILSRLPGLRVLSVGLGQRHAAACAVWETLSSDELVKKCRENGDAPPGEGDVYFVQTVPDADPHRLKAGPGVKSIVYRRIGPDVLPGGADGPARPHPAAWAKLDRQFLIKLQGEQPARVASAEEIWMVHQVEKKMNVRIPLIDRLIIQGSGSTEAQQRRLDALMKLGWKQASQPKAESARRMAKRDSLAVNELMLSVVTTLSRSLIDHGDGARIAFYMTADHKPAPGGRKYFFGKAEDASDGSSASERESRHIDLILDAFIAWHRLAYGSQRGDAQAAKWWNDHVKTLPGLKTVPLVEDGLSFAERRQRMDDRRESLLEPARQLLRNRELRERLNELWTGKWREDDKRWRSVIKDVKRWIMPKPGDRDLKAIRGAGGLSLSRIAAIKEFRGKVQAGFYTRLLPDGARETVPDKFAAKAMDTMEELREQRVKQIASRIVEAALGVGRMKPSSSGKDLKRPAERVDSPCHAVVIESLTRYRPDETRTRRENRGLMSWSSSKIKKHLEDSCYLNGIRLWEAPAAYTSRQDSRTGAPGLRCEDVPVERFLNSPYWEVGLERAKKRIDDKAGNSRDRYICDLHNKLQTDRGAPGNAGFVRIPVRGGDIFVSADNSSALARGFQADLNAAANIGIKGLLDPDWPGRWWYVPCEAGTLKPVPDIVKGSAVIDPSLPLAARNEVGAAAKAPARRSKKKKLMVGAKNIVNLWRDISSKPVDRDNGPWLGYAAYANLVQQRVVDILRRQAGLPSDNAD